MNDAKMTIRLPMSELEFAKSYARRSGFSLTALISRYLARLQSLTEWEKERGQSSYSSIPHQPGKRDTRDHGCTFDVGGQVLRVPHV